MSNINILNHTELQKDNNGAYKKAIKNKNVETKL